MALSSEKRLYGERWKGQGGEGEMSLYDLGCTKLEGLVEILLTGMALPLLKHYVLL